MSERELGRELLDLGNHLDVPGDDMLAVRVVAAIERSAVAAPVVVRRRRRLAATTAGASALAAPAVADWLQERIGGVEVRRVPTTVAPSLATALDLGRPVSLREAEAEAGFPIKQLGPRPADVWIDDIEGITVVSLVYPPSSELPATRSGAGALVQQFAAALDAPTVMGKSAGPDVTIERVEVDGHKGLWLRGGHGIFVGDRGRLQFAPTRLAANTLVWEADGVTYRLESSLERPPAIALAETLR